MTNSSQTARTDTAERMLDVAERLVQTRGFNGFSYADIASALGVTKASLHYHFPSKAELGLRLIERYCESLFGRTLRDLDASGVDSHTKLQTYVDLYAGLLHDNRMCLCGMLAADYATLPAPMQLAVTQFFAANEVWLAGILDTGRDAGELDFAGDPLEEARLLVGALEGTMLVARSFGDPARFKMTTDRLLFSLRANERVANP